MTENLQEAVKVKSNLCKKKKKDEKQLLLNIFYIINLFNCVTQKAPSTS